MRHSDLLENVAQFHEQMMAISAQGVEHWRPIVDAMIASQYRDTHQIERTLDYLLDLCVHDSGVILFKKLCRYHWQIDPQGVAFYVNSYREMWDSESPPSEGAMTSCEG